MRAPLEEFQLPVTGFDFSVARVSCNKMLQVSQSGVKHFRAIQSFQQTRCLLFYSVSSICFVSLIAEEVFFKNRSDLLQWKVCVKGIDVQET